MLFILSRQSIQEVLYTESSYHGPHKIRSTLVIFNIYLQRSKLDKQPVTNGIIPIMLDLWIGITLRSFGGTRAKCKQMYLTHLPWAQTSKVILILTPALSLVTN